MLLAATLAACACSPAHDPPTPVTWPRFGPARPGLALVGHTNEVPDVVGPVDGSARLTIFTEGNHFPVLLPLTLDEFPRSTNTSTSCGIKAEEILLVTLPQVMLVRALIDGSLMLGNLVLPLHLDRVYPDIVMAGEKPLSRLAQARVVQPRATPFARHRGMGMLVRRASRLGLSGLNDLPGTEARVILATPYEAGARGQYIKTLTHFLGETATQHILTKELTSFPGRLKIQHRDVPYALLTNQADVGLLFGHLADFYARSFPKALHAISIDEAEAFGQLIFMARGPSKRFERSPEPRCFERFLLERAKLSYPREGFSRPTEFPYGKQRPLGVSSNP